MNAKNQNIFYNSLKGVNWQNVLACNDAQEAYTCFIDIFTPLYNKAFPMKTIKLHKERVVKKWLNDDLIQMIKEKNRKYSEAIASTSIEKMNEYKTYRNRLNHVLRNAEKSYYRDLLRQNMYNLTNTWKILNGIIDQMTILCLNITIRL